MTGVFVGGTGESAGGGAVFAGVTVGSEVRVGVGSEVCVAWLGVLVAVLGTADGTAVVAVGGVVVPLGSAVNVGMVVSVVVGPGVSLPSGVSVTEVAVAV